MPGIIVHEWLAPAGGSENVFEAIMRVFPDAERWCVWNDAGGRFAPVNETVIARTPLRGRKAASVPVLPWVWRNLPRREADWVLASSHLFAHQARFGGPARHVPKLVYAHTPARYIWVPELDGRGGGLAARALSTVLKPIDRAYAQESVAIAANSAFIADRIAHSWEREAEIIYPPVEVAAFAAEPELTPAERAELDALPSEYVMGFSRFVSYKRLDAAIDAGRVSGLPVVLAGSGPDEEQLRALADQRHPGQVHIVRRPSNALLAALLQRASLLVFAPIEDFGIIPVEAMAAGTPVLANAVGGAVESVIDGTTGVHVHDWASDTELASAVDRALTMDPAACRARSRDFAPEVFATRIADFVSRHTGGLASKGDDDLRG